MAKRVTNKTRQAIPFQHVDGNGDLHFRILMGEESIVMADTRVGQDLTDKEAAGYITVVNSSDTITTGFS